MAEEKPLLIVLAGPTASGKTGLSLQLASLIGGSIVSADSMQIYRGLDIGSAKIMPEERQGIPHEMIDILDPREPFHVARFQQMAREAIDRIRDSGRIPILTGGTGFYIQAVIRDVDFSESEGASELRLRLEKTAEEKGPEYLHECLAVIDPEAAREIHAHNVRRVIRALEFYEQTGSTISGHNREQRKKESLYRLFYFVLTDERAKLYQQIDRRVDEMMENGLEPEVRALYEQGLTESHSSMKGIGYKEFFPYFRGECTREETVRQIKLNTRHYAKRQLTWFRREPDVIWIDRSSFGYSDEAILRYMTGLIKGGTERK